MRTAREEENVFPHLEKIARAIKGMALADVRRLAREGLKEEEIDVDRGEILALLFLRWAEEEPREAWSEITPLADRWRAPSISVDDARDRLRVATTLHHAVLRGWARSDPEAVLEILGERRADSFFRVLVSDGWVPRDIFEDWSGRDPAAAREAIGRFHGEARQYATQGYLSGLPADADWRAEGEAIPALVGSNLLEVTGSEDTRPSFLYAETYEEAIERAQVALAGRWLEVDLPAAFEWFVESSRKPISDEHAEVDRAERLSAILFHALDPDAARLLRWVGEQDWKWPYSDEIPLAYLRQDLAVYQNDIRPQILAAVRSEDKRFAFLVRLAMGRDKVYGNWNEFLAAGNLSAENERIVNDLLNRKENRSIDEILADPDRSSIDERVRRILEDACAPLWGETCPEERGRMGALPYLGNSLMV